MKRMLVLFAVLALLAAPLPRTGPHGAGAAGATMTVLTTDRNTGGPVTGACYAVMDRIEGGGRAAACDDDDGANDGTTTLFATDPCDACRISQGLPDDPVTGLPTDYLVEPPLDTGWGGTVTFRNFPKPYLVVTGVDARTGARVPGLCIAVQDVDRGGTVDGVCDGASNDPDGVRNGEVTTKRLLDGAYRVHQTQVPASHLKGAPVDVSALPGQVHRITLQVPARPRLVIETVDRRTGKRLKGACYSVADRTHGGGLGTLCDGQKNGDFGDQDGVKNGTIVTRPLQPDTVYLLHQQKAPRGYRPARDKEVTTVPGQDALVTVKNRRAA